MSATADVIETPAGEQARALHSDCLVFDGLAISYVLDERFAQRCLATLPAS